MLCHVNAGMCPIWICSLVIQKGDQIPYFCKSNVKFYTWYYKQSRLKGLCYGVAVGEKSNSRAQSEGLQKQFAFFLCVCALGAGSFIIYNNNKKAPSILPLDG